MTELDQPKQPNKFVAFVKEHKIQILVGTAIVLAIANRGLRHDVKDLRKDNKQMKTTLKENKELVDKAAVDVAAAELVLSQSYAPRWY